MAPMKLRTANRRDFLRTAALGVAALAGPGLRARTGRGAADRPAAGLPNFVVILADDLGYQDLGCYGSTKNRTPNLDRMAAEGTRFTSFCSTSGVCTPSRSSLMTGCYPRRVSLHEDDKGEWVLFPVSRKGLNPAEITVAGLLKMKGYATHAVGKWHLGDQPPFLPRRHGFEGYFGIPYSNDMGASAGSPNPPLPLMRDDDVVEAPVDQDTLTERYTKEAVRFIAEHKDRPFFLFLSHFVPHTPLHAGARFRGRSANGNYGDAVEELDGSVGEVLAALEAHGLERRTLVVFTSDNGGVRRENNGPLNGTKGSTLEGGHRVPFLARWPVRVPAGKICPELATMMDILPTFAALAGLEPPRDRVIDGHDITALLERPESAKTLTEVFNYYFMGQLQAVRSGRWKLHLPLKAKRHGWHLAPYEEKGMLFDLEADVAETTNVIAENPDVVARLTALAEKAREDLGDEGRDGKNQRPAGWFDGTRPLVLKRT
jgi:arylsulfatase A-like enzyme